MRGVIARGKSAALAKPRTQVPSSSLGRTVGQSQIHDRSGRISEYSVCKITVPSNTVI